MYKIEKQKDREDDIKRNSQSTWAPSLIEFQEQVITGLKDELVSKGRNKPESFGRVIQVLKMKKSITASQSFLS